MPATKAAKTAAYLHKEHKKIIYQGKQNQANIL